MVEVVTGNLLPAPRFEARLFALKKMRNHCTDSILQICLESLSEACLRTVLASVQTFFFSLLSMMELAAAKTNKKNEIDGLHVMDGKRLCSSRDIRFSREDPLLNRLVEAASAVLKVGSWKFVGQTPKAIHTQYPSYADIRFFALTIIEKIASKDSNGNSIGWGHALGEDNVSSMFRLKNALQPLYSMLLTRTQEKYSPNTCKVGDEDCFLQGPETDVRLSRKEITDWLATAKNKDDEDDEDDDEDDDDDDEPDDEGEGGEEGDEVEGEEPDEEDDDDDGEEADDGEGDEEDGDEGDGDEDGDDEEDDDDGEEDEGDEEDGDEDGDDGDGDEEDGDDDEDEDDEASEPPKKKRK